MHQNLQSLRRVQRSAGTDILRTIYAQESVYVTVELSVFTDVHSIVIADIQNFDIDHKDLFHSIKFIEKKMTSSW